MRSVVEVRERFRQLRAHGLRLRRDEFLRRTFRNCKHNERMRLRGEGQCGFCQNPEVLKLIKTEAFRCNDDETARRCRVYACRNTEASVEKDFEEILRTPARCGQDYPKLAILIWFLQSFKGETRGQRFRVAFVQFWAYLWRLLTFRWW